MSRIGLFGQISEINDHLYLSGAGVLKPEKIKQKNITFIVNATTEEPTTHLNGVDYLKICIDDSPHAHLDTYFDMVADRIKANKERGGRTLVHCVAGVSRSASLCLVYLVKHQRMTLRQAYYHVKAARPIIRPNVGFWRQMIDYEHSLLGVRSVELVPSVHHEREFVPDVYGRETRGGGAEQLMTRNGHVSSPNRTTPTTRRSLPLSTSARAHSTYPSPSSDRQFTYSSPSSYNYYSTSGAPTSGGLRSTLPSGRRSTSPAMSRLTKPYRNGATTLMLPTSKFHSGGGSSSRRPKPSSASKGGSIFSSIYQSSQEMFFPTF